MELMRLGGDMFWNESSSGTDPKILSKMLVFVGWDKSKLKGFEEGILLLSVLSSCSNSISCSLAANKELYELLLSGLIISARSSLYFSMLGREYRFLGRVKVRESMLFLHSSFAMSRIICSCCR